MERLMFVVREIEIEKLVLIINAAKLNLIDLQSPVN